MIIISSVLSGEAMENIASQKQKNRMQIAKVQIFIGIIHLNLIAGANQNCRRLIKKAEINY